MDLVASGSRSILFGLHDQQVIASRFRRQRRLFLSTWPAFGVHLQDLGAVGSQYLRHNINALLLDGRFQELTGSQLDLVDMPLPADQLAFDGLTRLKRADIPLITNVIRATSRFLSRMLGRAVCSPQN